MSKNIFIEVIKAYGISADKVYEDLSELGKVLWHNDKLALKVAWMQGKQPCLVLVVLRPTGEYLYFECNLEEFDISTLEKVIKFVQVNNELLYDTAIKATNALDISISNRNWAFKT